MKVAILTIIMAILLSISAEATDCNKYSVQGIFKYGDGTSTKHLLYAGSSIQGCGFSKTIIRYKGGSATIAVPGPPPVIDEGVPKPGILHNTGEQLMLLTDEASKVLSICVQIESSIWSLNEADFSFINGAVYVKNRTIPEGLSSITVRTDKGTIQQLVLTSK